MVYPKPIAVDYLSYVMTKFLKPAHALVMAHLVPLLPGLMAQARASRGDSADVRGDASYVDDLTSVVAKMAKESLAQAPSDASLVAELRAIVQRTDQYSAMGLSRQLKAVVGVDVTGEVPGMADTTAAFIKDNVRRIESISEDYFHDIEQITLRAFRIGGRAEDLAIELQERYDVSASKAALIAQDQIGKLNGEIVMSRQKGLGIRSYIWSTSEDERVRPEHEARDGDEFDWNDPPKDGHPGQAIRCRCSAIPVMPED